MPIFTVSRSQNWFLKNTKSTPTMTAAIDHHVKHDNYVSAHFSQHSPDDHIVGAVNSVFRGPLKRAADALHDPISYAVAQSKQS